MSVSMICRKETTSGVPPASQESTCSTVHKAISPATCRIFCSGQEFATVYYTGKKTQAKAKLLNYCHPVA